MAAQSESCTREEQLAFISFLGCIRFEDEKNAFLQGRGMLGTLLSAVSLKLKYQAFFTQSEPGIGVRKKTAKTKNYNKQPEQTHRKNKQNKQAEQSIETSKQYTKVEEISFKKIKTGRMWNYLAST